MRIGTHVGDYKAILPSPAMALSFVDGQDIDPRITFTRASSATYFDSAGALQRATYNLLLRSEEFDNAAWSKNSMSVTANSSVAPNGTTTADAIVVDVSGGRVEQSVTIQSGAQVILSIYAKAGTTNWFRYRVVAGATVRSAWFNAATGSVGTVESGTGSIVSMAGSIQAAGNGWYRCILSVVTTGTTSLTFGFAPTDADNTAAATVGVLVNFWGAQLEQSSTAGPYWATTSAANGAPRFDYNPSTLAPLGLLIEEQRTNSIRNNTMQGAVAGTPGTLPTNWSIGGLGTLTQTVVGTGTQNGINYIDIRFSGTTSTTQLTLRFESANAIAAANGQSWALSSWASFVAGSLANITNPTLATNLFDAGNVYVGEGPSAQITLTSALTRYTAAGAISNASTAFIRPYFYILFSSGVAIDITLRIGLPQLEQGAFATSVIPTTTAAATRAADNASMTGTNFSSWYNATEGTFYAEADTVETGTTSGGAFVINVSDGGSNNLHRIFRQSDTQPVMQTLVSGVAQTTFGFGANWTTTTPRKLAYAYKLNDFAGVVDAGAVQVDTSGTVPTVNQIDIGNGGSATQINGHIRRIAYFNTRLANANLQALTS